MKNRSNDIIFTEKQVTIAAVLLLLISFVSFVLGYYVGKNRDVLNITKEVIKDSFADQIAVSLYSAQKESLDNSSSVINNEADNDIMAMAKNNLGNENTQDTVCVEQLAKEHVPNDLIYHYAQLIGFGTERAANQCAKRWQMQGFPVTIQKRTSQSAKGKQSFWYQIITQDYSDKNELENLVKKIKKQEKLSDIRIISRNTARA